MKYRYKLLATYAALSIIPLLISGIVSTLITTQVVGRQTMDNFDRALHQTANLIAYKMEEIIGLTQVIAGNQLVRDILRRANAGYFDKEQELDDYLALSNILVSLEDHAYVINARLYIRGRALYIREQANIFAFEDRPQGENALVEPGRIQWEVTELELEPYSQPVRAILLSRGVPSLSSSRENLAVNELYCRVAIVDDVLDEFGIGVNAALYLHHTGQEVAFSAGEEFPISLLDRSLFPEMAEHLSLGTDRYLLRSTPVRGTPWHLSAIIAESSVNRGAYTILRFTVAMVTALILVDVFMALLVAGLVTKRLDDLVERMHALSEGNYDGIDVEGNDEITELQVQFNTMLGSIDRLMKRVAYVTDKQREAEYKALESQINPHFLYNTLDSIKWLAMRKKTQDVVDTIEALSNLYRFNLNKGREIVTVGEELNSIRDYIKIQNIRFGGKITLTIDVPRQITGNEIIKMTLQPLIENAVYHGIQNSLKKAGIITISGEVQDGRILLDVTDNGGGIEESRIESLLRQESGGYGLRNVDQRLKLFYGDEYGLTVRSKIGEGTVVSVRVPLDNEREF
jgi:two-component system, sensor histidine kinase YesM